MDVTCQTDSSHQTNIANQHLSCSALLLGYQCFGKLYRFDQKTSYSTAFSGRVFMKPRVTQDCIHSGRVQ
jgi:hypothetical protein